MGLWSLSEHSALQKVCLVEGKHFSPCNWFPGHLPCASNVPRFPWGWHHHLSIRKLRLKLLAEILTAITTWGWKMNPNCSPTEPSLNLWATVQGTQGPWFLCQKLQIQMNPRKKHEAWPNRATEAVRRGRDCCPVSPSSVPSTRQAKMEKSRCAYHPWGLLCPQWAAQRTSAVGNATSVWWGAWGRWRVWCPCPLSWRRGNGRVRPSMELWLPTPHNGLAVQSTKHLFQSEVTLWKGNGQQALSVVGEQESEVQASCVWPEGLLRTWLPSNATIKETPVCQLTLIGVRQ